MFAQNLLKKTVCFSKYNLQFVQQKLTTGITVEAQGSQRDRKDSIVSFVSTLSPLWLNLF